jgi:hypothetical protein
LPPVFPLQTKCICGNVIDFPNARHLEKCHKYNIIWAHDNMVQEFYRMQREAGFAVETEIAAHRVFPGCTNDNLRVDLFRKDTAETSPVVGTLLFVVLIRPHTLPPMMP